MENEYIGRKFHNLTSCEFWIQETTTLTQLSRLHDAFVHHAGQNLHLLGSKVYYEGMLRAKVIEFYQKGESPEPPQSKDLRDWQVWFVQALSMLDNGSKFGFADRAD